MAQEVEAKIPVDSFAPVREALRASDAVFLGKVLQSDTYFDTPDGALQHSDRGMRIRRVELLEPGAAQWDTRPELTYKGPRQGEAMYKTRREIQTHVDAAEAMMEVLAACGMVRSMEIQKRRASYRLDPCLVELDELPFIGRFVEIEGPDQERICACAAALGLDAGTIQDSYLHLAVEALALRGLDTTRVTFEAESSVG
jgi:adenylate cyclase class 2